jgi:hypothetical protein
MTAEVIAFPKPKTIVDAPAPLEPELRAVLPKYYEVLRGKIARRSLTRAAAGRKVPATVEIDIVRRLAREIRKRIDAETPGPVLERARTAHMRGCLSTRVAAILGVSAYEAETWANLATPRERPYQSRETSDDGDE